MARFERCKAGHDAPRNRWGQCVECKRLSNAGDLRLPLGDHWRDAPAQPSTRIAHWEAFCAALDDVMAMARSAEGFDSRERPWARTLGDPALYRPVAPAQERKAS